MKLADKINTEREESRRLITEAFNKLVDDFIIPEWIINELSQLVSKDYRKLWLDPINHPEFYTFTMAASSVRTKRVLPWFWRWEYENKPYEEITFNYKYCDLLIAKLEKEGFTAYLDSFPYNYPKREVIIRLTKEEIK
jgi:hypothetical protein